MGKSSKDKRDAYYRLAKEQNWRARSAFKLIQIDEEFDLFSHSDPSQCTRVVDLCAAPGSWSQVLSRVLISGESFGRRAWAEKMSKLDRAMSRLRSGTDLSDISFDASDSEDDLSTPKMQPRQGVKIVAIDLQPMAPLPGIIQLQADITHPSTVPLLLKALDPESTPSHLSSTTHRVDLVISDGAPDVTGLHSLDIYIQATLLYSALSLALKVLRPGGKFVAKIFRGKDVDLIYAQLRCVFQRVTVAKPRASRASSIEAFVVCEGYTPLFELDDEDRDIRSQLAQLTTSSSSTDLQHQTRTTKPDGVVELTFSSKSFLSKTTSQSPDTSSAKIQDFHLHQNDDENHEPLFSKSKRWIPPFLATGDLSTSYDSDATYKLPADHVSLDPVQPPTAPPYKEAIERRRLGGGMYGKTKASKGVGLGSSAAGAELG